MKHLAVSLVFVAFFSLIGAVCYLTESAWPLWALILTPHWESRSDDNDGR